MSTTKKEFFAEHDQKFLPRGFEKITDNPFFFYSKPLNIDYEGNIPPALLYGNTGENSGFCIYTGLNFIWLNCLCIEDAISMTEWIVAVEEP